MSDAAWLALFPPGVRAASLAGGADPGPLWPEEAAAVARAVPRRVREFAAGRDCARRALSALGHPPRAIPQGPDRAPSWPPGVVGSISHCAGWCGAVVGEASAFAGLGLDVELRDRVEEKLLRRIAAGEELAALAALAPATRRCESTLLFSAKEAFYKAQYPSSRSFVGLRDAIFRRVDDERFEIELCIAVPGVGAAGSRFEGRYRFTDGHVFAGLSLPAGPPAPTGSGPTAPGTSA